MADVKDGAPQSATANSRANLMFPADIRGLKATLIGEFTRQGEPRYRYAITGTPAAMEAWKKARGQYYIEDEVTKQVIFIAIPNVALALLGCGGKMMITTSGRCVADQNTLQELAEDKLMYRQAKAQAQAQADVAHGTVGRAFGGATSTPRNFSIPNQATINANADLSNPANEGLTEAELAEQEALNQ